MNSGLSNAQLKIFWMVGAEIGECCNTEAYVGICEGAVVVDYVMTGGAGSKSGYVCDTGARVGSK